MKKFLFSIAVCALALAACQRDYSISYEVEHTPTMGMSFWNAFQLNINEDLVKDQALAVSELGYADAGYKFINIDDGFQRPRDAEGNFMYDASLFPSGMRAVADYIHSLGLKAGIYTDAGDNTCGSENKYAYGLGTGLVGHEAADCKLFFDEWDYDFIKIDFCGGQNAGLDEREQYTKIAEAIRACNKKDIIFNICRWRFPGTWAADLATSWRTTYDIRPWFSRVKYIIDENLWLQAYTRGGHYNDCDMLEIGSKWPGSDARLSHDEELTHMAYWCIASSPLIMGCDMRKVPESSREVMLNKDLIRMNQDRLGLGAPVVQREGEVYVVAKDMKAIMGPERAVVVMNLSEQERSIDVSVEALGFKGPISLYDCFTHQDREDGYDFVEWLATQDWCNGKIGMTGNSGVAMHQWGIAAECPPHLACIAPWESTTDLYSDSLYEGGIPALSFNEFIAAQVTGLGGVDDQVAMARKYPLYNGYWEDKVADFSKVKIPVYNQKRYFISALQTGLNAANVNYYGSFDSKKTPGDAVLIKEISSVYIGHF